MLVELENAILAKINLEDIAAKIFDFKTNRATRKENVPTVFVELDGAEFTFAEDDKFFQDVSILLTVVFKILKGEEDRRAGIYPILEGITQSLQLQNLGLDIEPIQPRNFKNITDPEDAERGEIIFQMEFWTQYTVDKAAEDPPPSNLLTIGVKYYLQIPVDDGLVDAEDIIT